MAYRKFEAKLDSEPDGESFWHYVPAADRPERAAEFFAETENDCEPENFKHSFTIVVREQGETDPAKYHKFDVAATVEYTAKVKP